MCLCVCVCLSVYLSVCLSVCLSICLSVCLSLFFSEGFVSWECYSFILFLAFISCSSLRRLFPVIVYHSFPTKIDAGLSLRIILQSVLLYICLESGYQLMLSNDLPLLRSISGCSLFVRVEVMLRGATFHVLFTDASQLPPPFRIDNLSEVCVNS